MSETVVVNMNNHDVAILARKNYPVVFVDGMFIQGVVQAAFENNKTDDVCRVSLTLDEQIQENVYPLNDINLLRKLFGRTDGKSLRDTVAEILQDDDSCQDLQKN